MFMQFDSIFRSKSKQLNDASQTHTHTLSLPKDKSISTSVWAGKPTLRVFSVFIY